MMPIAVALSYSGGIAVRHVGLHVLLDTFPSFRARTLHNHE